MSSEVHKQSFCDSSDTGMPALTKSRVVDFDINAAIIRGLSQPFPAKGIDPRASCCIRIQLYSGTAVPMSILLFDTFYSELRTLRRNDHSAHANVAAGGSMQTPRTGAPKTCRTLSESALAPSPMFPRCLNWT